MSEPIEPRAVLDRTAKKAIIKHAEKLYNSMPNKQPVTDQNIAGIRTNMHTAIELAEMFHEVLALKGYDSALREEDL